MIGKRHRERDMVPKFSAQTPQRVFKFLFAPKKPFVKKDWKNKGTIMTTILNDEIPIPTSPNLIPVFLTLRLRGENQEN